jgi:hypothetical protein
MMIVEDVGQDDESSGCGCENVRDVNDDGRDWHKDLEESESQLLLGLDSTQAVLLIYEESVKTAKNPKETWEMLPQV